MLQQILLFSILFCSGLGQFQDRNYYLTYADSGCVFSYQSVRLVPLPDLEISMGVKVLDVLLLNLTGIVYSDTYNLATWYCPPLSGSLESNHNRLVVIVPGGTYTHLYNDWPMTDYSHVHKLRQAGYQVVNIDRMGMGLSDQPPAALLSIRSQAYIVHQLIVKIKEGAYGAPPTKLFYIGHSLSAILGCYLTFWWPSDVSAFVLTGWAHTPTVGLVEVAPFLLTPAHLEEQFEHTPLGYITTAPGSRWFEWYSCNRADYDQAVVDLDEFTKGTATLSEFIDGFTGGWLIPLTSISIPLYQLIGHRDRPICPPNLLLKPNCIQPTSPFKEILQRVFFPLCPDYKFEVIPNSGHDLTLHLNRGDYFSKVNDWLNDH